MRKFGNVDNSNEGRLDAGKPKSGNTPWGTWIGEPGLFGTGLGNPV